MTLVGIVGMPGSVLAEDDSAQSVVLPLVNYQAILDENSNLKTQVRYLEDILRSEGEPGNMDHLRTALMTMARRITTLEKEKDDLEEKIQFLRKNTIYAAESHRSGNIPEPRNLPFSLMLMDESISEAVSLENPYRKTAEAGKRNLLEVLANSPDNYEAYLKLHQLYLDEENYDKAVSTLENLLLIHPGFGEAHYRLALTCLRDNRLEEARQALDDYRRIQPEDTLRIRMLEEKIQAVASANHR